MATAVYLVHYQQPRHHIRHGVRVVTGPAAMIRQLHRYLDEPHIDPKASDFGIGFVLVRTWAGRDSRFERKLKRQKHHSRLCPVCNPERYATRTRRTFV